MITLQTAKVINKAITSIVARSTKLDGDIHATAIQTMMHAEKHGDCTLASRLVNTLGKSIRSKALIHWFETFSPLRRSRKSGEFELVKNKAKRTWHCAKAFDIPFYDLSNEKEPVKVSYDSVKKLIESIAKRVDKAEDEGRIDGDVTKIKALLKAHKITA